MKEEKGVIKRVRAERKEGIRVVELKRTNEGRKGGVKRGRRRAEGRMFERFKER